MSDFVILQGNTLPIVDASGGQGAPGANAALGTDLAASSGSGLVGTIRSEAGATARTVQDKLRDVISIKDFGAVCDGVTDDRAAFAAAVAAARGMQLIVPDNTLINSDGGTITLEEIEIVGENVLDGATASIDRGSNILITGTTNTPFKVRRGVDVSGLGFYYPNQADSASPTAYPPTFTFDFTNGAVQFVKFHRNVVYNAYKWIDISDVSGNVGHVEIEGNYICALNLAIYLRNNTEHFRVHANNFTFGHWLAATEAGARSYMRANATALKVDQSDGVEFTDNMVYGHLNGLLESASGLCQFQNISLNKFDNVRYPVKATGSGRFDGHIIANTFNSLNGQSTSLQGRSIEVSTSGSGLESLTITGNDFVQATEDHIFTSGNTPTRKLVIGPNNYRSWAAFKAAGAYGAVNASGTLTNVQVSGGWFYGANSAAFSKGIIGTLNTLQVSGATFEQCLAAIDVTAAHVTTSGNRSFTTGGATSDVIAGATSIWQTGNNWDKPSGSTTKPYFLARKNASQTFNSGTATDVTWGTEAHDKGSNFATPSFTASLAGPHMFDFALMHDNTGTAGDRFTVLMLINGTTYKIWSQKMIADYDTIEGAAYAFLAVGDVVKLQVRRDNGAGSFVTFNDPTANYFSGHYVG